MFDLLIFFFKQKTAYDMRISDWSSDVCSSDLSSWIFDGFGGNKTEDAMNFWRGLPIEGRKIDLRVLARMKLIHIGGGNPGIDRQDSTIRHDLQNGLPRRDRKSTRLNSSH